MNSATYLLEYLPQVMISMDTFCALFGGALTVMLVVPLALAWVDPVVPLAVI